MVYEKTQIHELKTSSWKDEYYFIWKINRRSESERMDIVTTVESCVKKIKILFLWNKKNLWL